MTYQCPGSIPLKNAELRTRICPVCGNEIEIFSTELKGTCDKCGFTAYDDSAGCIKWCKFARDCLGEDQYERMMAKSR